MTSKTAGTMAKFIHRNLAGRRIREFAQTLYVAVPIAECSIEDTPGHARSAEPSGDFQDAGFLDLLDYVERLIGSIRRECLDHVIVLNQTHLRHMLSQYISYDHGSLTYLSPAKERPDAQTRAGHRGR